MAQVRVLILRAAGTNCDLETQHAWQLAGADPMRVHVRRLIEQPRLLHDFQVLTIPGGFSYGDDIAAGRILAAQVRRHLLQDIWRFIDQDKLILGICNGFQVLVQAGLLPFRRPDGRSKVCAIAGNDPPGFQDRWVHLQAAGGRCVFLEPGRRYELPIAHSEGRVLFKDDSSFQAVVGAGQNALLYVGPQSGQVSPRNLPHNPNGSQGDIAGLCDETGRVLGLMPHPERFVTWMQHPCWPYLPTGGEGDGLGIFRCAVRYFE